MSRDNIKKHRSREERKKLLVRVVALIMAILMVGGMAYYTIYVLTASISAEDSTNEVTDTSSLTTGGDILISVGLMFGSNLTKSFEVTTTDGFTVGSQTLYGDREFTELWDLDETRISCTVDDNLSYSYDLASGTDDTAVGGYHLQVNCPGYSRRELEELIGDTEQEVRNLGLYLIPSYVDYSYALRVGDFASMQDAREYLDKVEDIFSRQSVSVISPESTAVSVVSPENDRILFEFDCGAKLELGLAAHEDRNGNTYLKTPAGNVYDGVFCFKRYDNGNVEGVELINFLALEAYIAGVLPYETSNTWPLETLKAFAITVRSYTLSHLEKHMDVYGFDICNTTECQVYKGAGSINERIIDAVLGTAGQILVYGDKIVNAYYSSSMGGVTVSAEDAWGGQGKYPYLQAVETPWERYMTHYNGFWITEVSPAALLERMHQAGYTQLEDAIEDVEIVQLAANSTYVKQLRVTDIHGTSIDIYYTDNVRTSLTPYVKSANFVVGKGSVEYTENVVVEEDYASEDDDDDSSGSSYDFDPREEGYSNVDGCYVITSDSLDRNYTDLWTTIATGDGMEQYGKVDFFVITSQNASAFLGEEYDSYAAQTEEKTTEPQYNTEILTDKSGDDIIYKVAYAENSDNFIFVGKGWGHGVGMSQYGARDLADLGYKATDILNAYFTGVSIVDYKDFLK